MMMMMMMMIRRESPILGIPVAEGYKSRPFLDKVEGRIRKRFLKYHKHLHH